MSAKASKEITEKKLLLVEGNDEVVFFGALLDSKGASGIQIEESGGKSQFAAKLGAIKNTPGFDNVQSMAVIHDADNNVDGSFQRIQDALKKHGFKAPEGKGLFAQGSPKVGVFLIPDNKSAGMLESLCLSAVKSKEVIECVDSFMRCVNTAAKNKIYKEPRNIHKARLRAFLAAMEKDTPSLGLAAEKGYLDLNSEKLQPLLNFLKKL